MTTPHVRASGGVLFRPVDDDFELLVVHRPKYDDWSLPKGKDDPGETSEQAAAREVEEETGYRPKIISELAEQRYTLPDGRQKAVRYYAMRPLTSRPFIPNAEVDEIRWVPLAAARELLTYPRDRDLITDADFPTLVRTSKFFLIRHADAGNRSLWEGDDRARPLSAEGRAQAEGLVPMLLPFGIDRIYSSGHLRCVQTVEPLAARTGLEVIELPELAEGSRWQQALEVVESSSGHNVAACSHGDVIPDLIRGLANRGIDARSPDGRLVCAKGSTWALTVEDGEVASAEYVPPPR